MSEFFVFWKTKHFILALFFFLSSFALLLPN